MNHIKTMKKVGYYLVILGILVFSICMFEANSDAVAAGFMLLILIIVPGVILIIVTNKLGKALPGYIRACMEATISREKQNSM